MYVNIALYFSSVVHINVATHTYTALEIPSLKTGNNIFFTVLGQNWNFIASAAEWGLFIIFVSFLSGFLWMVGLIGLIYVLALMGVRSSMSFWSSKQHLTNSVLVTFPSELTSIRAKIPLARASGLSNWSMATWLGPIML